MIKWSISNNKKFHDLAIGTYFIFVEENKNSTQELCYKQGATEYVWIKSNGKLDFLNHTTNRDVREVEVEFNLSVKIKN